MLGEPAYGPYAGGNLDVGALGDYDLKPGTARRGWLTFEQKPGPLTTLYVTTTDNEMALWDLTDRR